MIHTPQPRMPEPDPQWKSTVPMTENVCEKNCPDFNGMTLLHTEECDCSCHPVLTKGTPQIGGAEFHVFEKELRDCLTNPPPAIKGEISN